MIVVTGGAGFIGSNIIAALNESGRLDVAICDWLGTGGKWLNLRKRSFTDFVRPQKLMDWLEGRSDVQAIIHMGAISATTAVDGDEVIENNFVLSVQLLDHAARRDIPFLYASSAAVYGDGEQAFIDSIDPDAIQALRPLNLYGWSKRQFDLVVADRMTKGGPLPHRCTGFRFFNVFGPNEAHKDDMKSVVAKIFPVVSRGDAVSLFKSHRDGIADGDQQRDFIYVKDAVSVVLWALGSQGRSGIFNVGTGKARSFRALTEAVFEAVGKPRRIEYVDMPESIREKYQYFTEASLDRLRQAGYTGTFLSLEEAVGDYVKYLAQPDPFR